MLDSTDAIFVFSYEIAYFVTVVFVERCRDTGVGEEFGLTSPNSDLGVAEDSVEVVVSEGSFPFLAAVGLPAGH